MASKRKSTTPCMVLPTETLEQDPDLRDDFDEGPPQDMRVEGITVESVSSEEEMQENDSIDNQDNKKVEGGYECKYCSFQTPDLNLFTFHVDSEHPNVVLNSSYVCVECNFLTKRYDALSEHNVKYHPGEDNFKLTMVKRNNQTVFEQTVNDLTFDGNFVQEENEEQTENPPAGISISKTPIMKMMKTKTESKRIAVSYNLAEGDAPVEQDKKLEPEPEVTGAETVASTVEPVSSTVVVGAPHETNGNIINSATVLQTGLAQVITALNAQQNSNLVQKVLIPVNSIPTYNAAMDNNPLLLNNYNKFPYPTLSEITILAAQTKYSEEQIKIWFSAQRLKHGVSWTPEEVEEARRKQYNGTVHTVPQTITVIPAQISAANNGLQSILQTCQIMGQPGLVLTQVAGTNALPVSTPITLTVAGVSSQTQLQKSNVQPVQPVTESERAPIVQSPHITSHDSSLMSNDSFGVRPKKTKEQLAELKASYIRSQFPQDSEIARLMKVTGLTKGEIKKWFSDTRYNQRNSKSNQSLNSSNDASSTIIIDSSDETVETPTVGAQQRRQSWNPFPDFTPQKFKEKTAEQLNILEKSYLTSSVPADDELNKLRTETKLTRREIDAWFSERRKMKDFIKEKSEKTEDEPGNPNSESGDISPAVGSSTPKWGISQPSKFSKKTPEQLHILKSAFVRTQWPSAGEYDKLAQETGIARTDIVSWFGDTRYAWKNGNLKWYYYYQSGNVDTLNGQTFVKKKGRGRPKGRPRGRPRGRPKGLKKPAWENIPSPLKFKTGKTILKEYYLKHKFLNEQDLDELVAKSHMGYEQVREWFAERQRREELGVDLFEENEGTEEVEDDLGEEDEDEDETDDSDTWEPPRHVRRKLSKVDD
ncbi:zinc fingers and homeoboxes protein 1 [Latimeria chalumnae]|uniref:Zinc fingers and homeoboxes protein 1 n=1 Tax=Latimeria chalumnae TaxID=7897 RepID=H3AQA9_LATCH|nr:PREDICTED: zinc fingers and homeoboxes protein 1 [Latimeria chalumnae]XP_006007085.1 PREDICTED: zinc fingers and homeoboxes protein 1 [Latimeria chalumnae]|eukprot:XP_006007084.1 PREDICTED: zinc fingers and homeoboxes protein 1 [Latimeria chalumnae]